MNVFCLLFVPLFYLLRRALLPKDELSFPEPGLVSGFLAGLILAFFRLLLGKTPDLSASGLGSFLEQFLYAVLPGGILPLVCYLLVFYSGNKKRPFSEDDAVLFSLAWLVPGNVIRALSLGAIPDPVSLMLVPVLETALVISIPYWTGRALRDYGISQAFAIMSIVIVPASVALASWAFYTGNTLFGALFFCASCAFSLPAMRIGRKSLKS